MMNVIDDELTPAQHMTDKQAGESLLREVEGLGADEFSRARFRLLESLHGVMIYGLRVKRKQREQNDE